MRGEVFAEPDGELRPLAGRFLECDHLAEPAASLVLEEDVAARLEGELVERGLKGEAAPVDGGRERRDRALELAPDAPVAVQPARERPRLDRHATSLHSSMGTASPAPSCPSSTVQASSRTS